jgi:hypothetical protein
MIHDEKGARDRAWCELQRAKTAGNSTRVRLSTTSCPSGMRKHKKTSVQHVRDDSAPLPPTTARKHAESSRHPNPNVVTPSMSKGKQPFKAPRTDITSHYRQYGKALDAASAKTKKIEQTDGPEQPSHAQKEALAKIQGSLPDPSRFLRAFSREESEASARAPAFPDYVRSQFEQKHYNEYDIRRHATKGRTP